MSNKGVIVGIVVILLALLIVFAISMSNETSEENNTTEEETTEEEMTEEETSENEEEENETSEEEGDNNVAATVTYTDDGYDPIEVTISVGETVEFVNESSNDMWTASDVHPSHTEYSEFDQLSAGDRYSFTFEQAGEWSYHNHLRPNDVGTVIVEE